MKSVAPLSFKNIKITIVRHNYNGLKQIQDLKEVTRVEKGLGQ